MVLYFFNHSDMQNISKKIGKKKNMQNKILSQKPTSVTWGFKGTLVWGGIITFFYLVSQIVAMLFFTFITYGNILKENIELIKYNGLALSCEIFVMFIVCNFFIWTAIKIKKGSNIVNYLAASIPDKNKIYFWVLIAIIFAVTNDLVSLTLGKSTTPEFMLNIKIQDNYVWVIFLIAVLATSIFEEIFFRGFLFAGLSTTFLGSIGTIITTSLAWALIHFQYGVFEIFSIFIIGLLLGLARQKTNSILIPILMHCTINVISFVEMIFS